MRQPDMQTCKSCTTICELKIAINNKENWCATIGSRPQGAGSTDVKFTNQPMADANRQ